MHITTSITQSSSKLISTHVNNQNILPKQIKEVFSKKRQINSQKNTHTLVPLSSQLTRLVDACGDCV